MTLKLNINSAIIVGLNSFIGIYGNVYCKSEFLLNSAQRKMLVIILLIALELKRIH